MSPYKDSRTGKFHADFVDENGKRQRPALGALAENMTQARDAERRLKVRVDEIRLGLAPRDRNPMNYTVATALDWYLTESPAKKQKGIKSKRYVMKKHVVGDFASLRIDLVHSGHVATWLDEREDEDDLSGASVNRLRSYLMGMFTQLKKYKLLVGENPVKDTDKRHEEEPAPRLLPFAVPPIVIDNAPTKAWRLIFKLAAYALLRRGEIRRLRAHHIDLDRGIIRIEKTKTKKNRIVPIHPELREDLEEAMNAGGVIVPKAAWGQSGEVTRAAMMRGGVFIDDGVTPRPPEATIVIPQGTQACFHSLRHTASTCAVECGADPWVIDFIGWGPKDSSTMQKSYLKPVDVLARELAKLRYPRASQVVDINTAKKGTAS